MSSILYSAAHPDGFAGALRDLGRGSVSTPTSDRAAEANDREALLAFVRRFVREHDPETTPADQGCLECTHGTTPVHRERGPCLYHTAVRLLARADGGRP